jgi:hypothetical protein
MDDGEPFPQATAFEDFKITPVAGYDIYDSAQPLNAPFPNRSRRSFLNNTRATSSDVFSSSSSKEK